MPDIRPKYLCLVFKMCSRRRIQASYFDLKNPGQG
jgi:hypothetical protein